MADGDAKPHSLGQWSANCEPRFAAQLTNESGDHGPRKTGYKTDMGYSGKGDFN